MLNPDLKLNPNIFNQEVEQQATRDGFGEGLVIAGEKNQQVVALCADVTESVRMNLFRDRFPERFIEVGIAEQNMIGVASGLASSGKIPVAATYGVFSPGRAWEQIRTTICYNQQKVILVGSHTGLNVGPDGASHQMTEDIALTRVLPNLAVIVPADSLEARKAILAAVNYPISVYLRLNREKSPLLTTLDSSFEIGQSSVFWLPDENKNEEFCGITILACGYLVFKALQAARELAEEKIFTTVINVSTIKPLDEGLILEWARKSNAFLTIEEHQINGGLGGAIAEFISSTQPILVKRMGLKDIFGESGEAEELITKYGLDKEEIKKTVKSLLK